MDEHVPLRLHPALHPYVAAVAGYRLSGFRPGQHIGVPSSAVTCVIDLAEPLRIGLPSGQIVRSDASASGFRRTPVTIHHDGHQHGVMLFLTPLGVRAFSGIPAGELFEQTISLRAVLGPGIDDVVDRMRSAPGWSCLRLLHEALLHRLPRSEPDTDGLRLWGALADRDVREPLRDFIAHSGWSERFVREHLRAELGTGAGTLRRLLRFEQSVTIATRGSLADVAARVGYADQAHLSREWQQYLGVSPSAFLSREEFIPA